MKTTLIISLLILQTMTSFGQDTIFFDADWNPATRSNAEFCRIDQKTGAKWIRMDYYFKTMQLQMKGTYCSLTPETEDGYFEWYYPNGSLRHKGNYVNGMHTGEHLWYNEKGGLEAKENYKNGKLHGAYEEYYPNGKLMDKATFSNGIQQGWAIYYREDGAKQSEGNFKNGNRDGEWKYYDETGKLEGTTVFKTEYDFREANLFLQLPNDEWYLDSQSDTGPINYIFKRNEIIDSSGTAIIPAIMLFIEDAKEYNHDVVLYSLQKRLPFLNNGIEINNKILIPTDAEFPFSSFKNAMIITASYSRNGLEHIFYMVYIINDDDKGIQIYMDMTKNIAEKYEAEFQTTLHSIKELR